MHEDKEKIRLDQLVVNQGLAPSREKAQALIMAGKIFAHSQRLDKSGQKVSVQLKLELKGEPLPYVSRGGLKLEKAIELFDLKVQDKTGLDLGASTGGFTDCALQKGAAHMIAVDVGYGQLDWRLRQDPRVTVMEKTNARYLKEEDLGAKVDFVTMDLSFISLGKIFPILPQVLKSEGWGLALIKPQFEAGRERVGKKGVVRDLSAHREVLLKVLSQSRESSLRPLGLGHSPIKGPEGNVEYLFWFDLAPEEDSKTLSELDIDALLETTAAMMKGERHAP